MSTLQKYIKHYESLVHLLPMKDAIFMAILFSKGLLPSNLKSTIQAQQTSVEKATVFLDQVITPTLQNDNLTPFKTLLSIMEDGDDDGLKKLANMIRSSLDWVHSSCSNSKLNSWICVMCRTCIYVYFGTVELCNVILYTVRNASCVLVDS